MFHGRCSDNSLQVHYLILFATSSKEEYCISLEFQSRRSLGDWASYDSHQPSFPSLPLSLEFPFNCDTSSGLWRTAHPVISRHYPGMRGQVLPVQSMSARCMVLSHLSFVKLYHAISLSISRRSPSLYLCRSLASQMQRELLPARVLHAQGQPQSRRPRCKPLNYSMAPEAQGSNRSNWHCPGMGSHPEIQGVLAKLIQFSSIRMRKMRKMRKEKSDREKYSLSEKY